MKKARSVERKRKRRLAERQLEMALQVDGKLKV